MDSLELNGKTFYYDEIANYSFRTSIPINGYEAKVLEFCRNWLTGQQEFSVHTSGSTGTPKNITLTRQQLEASAKKTVKALKLKKKDRALVCLNVEAVSGMMMLVRGFTTDLHLTIIEPIGNPLTYSKTEKPFDFISLVPYQLQTILTESPDKKLFLDFAKAILLGGAPISQELEKEILSIKAPVYLSYGMTETASHIALRRLNGDQPEANYTTFPDILLGQDERGCLTIKGEVTNNDLVITNDLVALHGENQFSWLGRVDNIINSGGHKIQLEKVEVALALALNNLEISGRSFVTAVPDQKLGNKLIAILESDELPDSTQKNLKAELAHLLFKYERPKAIYFTKQFKTTASGKIDRIATVTSLNQDF